MTDPLPEPPAKVHPLLAIPLLPFVLVYDGARWLLRRLGHWVASVAETLGRLMRTLWSWLVAPFRALGRLLGHVLVTGLRRTQPGPRHACSGARDHAWPQAPRLSLRAAGTTPSRS